MMSLQTVPLYGKHWPPVVDILVQDRTREDKRRQNKTRQDNTTQEHNHNHNQHNTNTKTEQMTTEGKKKVVRYIRYKESFRYKYSL
jgi:hypothetical protein